MRWLGRSAAVLTLALAGIGLARGDARDSQLEAVAKTEGLLDSALAEREATARQRVRALYKLSRAGDGPLWVDREARERRVRWRGAARRIISRDLAELALFREERAVAARARARLEALAPAPLPAEGSLTAPVPGAIVAGPGLYRHRRSRAELSRRGALLRSAAGQEVVAPADGRIAFAGPLRGLGQAVVMDHGDFYTVVGHLQTAEVSPDDAIARGQRLGSAAGTRVYLEVRRRAGPGGEPVDPAPLLAR